MGSKSASAAVYADPKSGATWSGRDRAPFWIAGGAKDRSGFVVDGSKSSSVLAANEAAKAGITVVAHNRRCIVIRSLVRHGAAALRPGSLG